jgi:hypothetical protein
MLSVRRLIKVFALCHAVSIGVVCAAEQSHIVIFLAMAM